VISQIVERHLTEKTRAPIREHPQLKAYLEPDDPPGYVPIKSRSRPKGVVEG
jgi:hypothetical protein